MLKRPVIHKILTVLIAMGWFINGLLCKVLNLVPRHQQIVARILGDTYSDVLTKSIGILEILMGVWILTHIQSRTNAIAQMLLVAVMNSIEFVMAPDLLLWGRMNAIYALVFILVIYYNEFVLGKPLAQQL